MVEVRSHFYHLSKDRDRTCGWSSPGESIDHWKAKERLRERLSEGIVVLQTCKKCHRNVRLDLLADITNVRIECPLESDSQLFRIDVAILGEERAPIFLVEIRHKNAVPYKKALALEPFDWVEVTASAVMGLREEDGSLNLRDRGSNGELVAIGGREIPKCPRCLQREADEADARPLAETLVSEIKRLFAIWNTETIQTEESKDIDLLAAVDDKWYAAMNKQLRRGYVTPKQFLVTRRILRSSGYLPHPRQWRIRLDAMDVDFLLNLGPDAKRAVWEALQPTQRAAMILASRRTNARSKAERMAVDQAYDLLTDLHDSDPLGQWLQSIWCDEANREPMTV